MNQNLLELINAKRAKMASDYFKRLPTTSVRGHLIVPLTEDALANLIGTALVEGLQIANDRLEPSERNFKRTLDNASKP